MDHAREFHRQLRESMEKQEELELVRDSLELKDL